MSASLSFERSLREFVSVGCNWMSGTAEKEESLQLLPRGKCIPGQQSGESPKGLFAAVWFLGSSSHYSYNYFDQGRFPDDLRLPPLLEPNIEKLRTRSIQMIDASYMIQFYRKNKEYNCDAVEAARCFADWVDTHTGITWAATAITDGRLAGVNIYHEQVNPVAGEDPLKSDTRYEPNKVFDAIVVDQHPDDISPDIPPIDEQSKAKVEFFSSSNGKIESGRIIKPGKGYIRRPEFRLEPNFTITTWRNNENYDKDDEQSDQYIRSTQTYPPLSGVNTPWASFRGGGFSIQRPIVFHDITDAVSTKNAEWEPRAALTLDVQYERHYSDPLSRNFEPAGGMDEFQLERSAPPLGTEIS